MTSVGVCECGAGNGECVGECVGEGKTRGRVHLHGLSRSRDDWRSRGRLRRAPDFFDLSLVERRSARADRGAPAVIGARCVHRSAQRHLAHLLGVGVVLPRLPNKLDVFGDEDDERFRDVAVLPTHAIDRNARERRPVVTRGNPSCDIGVRLGSGSERGVDNLTVANRLGSSDGKCECDGSRGCGEWRWEAEGCGRLQGARYAIMRRVWRV